MLDHRAMHGLAGEIVRAIEPMTEADPAALLASILTCASTLIGSGPRTILTGGEQQAKLFSLIVGPTSAGRKGTSWSNACTALDQAIPGWRREHETSGHASGEALIEALGAKDHGRFVMCEPEFARFLSASGREGSTLSQVLRDLWDKDYAQCLSRSNPVTVDDVHLGVVAHVTPDELKAKLRSTEVSGGTANRFLFIASLRRQLVSAVGRTARIDLGPLAARLADVIERASGRTELEWTDEASLVWDWLYALVENRTGTAPEMEPFVARWAPQTIRLALVYALLDDAPKITLDHLAAGYALWNYSEATVAYLFSEGGLGNPTAEKLFKALQATPGGLDGKARVKLFSGHRSSSEIDEAIELLAARGLAQLISEPTGGRARSVLVLSGAEKQAEEANKAA